MKFKTFIVTFILFLTVFFASLLLISVFFYNSQVDSVVERSLNEHYLLSNSMGKEFDRLYLKGANTEDIIQYLFNYYSEHYARQKGYIEIFEGSKLLYSSFPMGAYFETNLDFSEHNRVVEISRKDHKSYIAITGEFPLTGRAYSIQYIYDFTNQMKVWENMRNILLLIGFVFSLIVAVMLIALLNLIFKPLGQIVVASKEIADGNYEKRIQMSESHELISLADSFNDMADKVQLAITTLSNDGKQKQQFIDNFSHEIRTPLTSVYGFAEYMQKSTLSEEERINISGYIMEDSKHILRIADRLLDLATLRNQGIVNHKYSVDKLYETTEKSLRNRLSEKQIILTKERNVEAIYGDEELLQCILINLTNNAIDASNPKGTIQWNTYKEGKHIILSVSDEGKGISEKDLDKINEPFYRADKTRSRESGNAGLGLAICQQIAESHNAKMMFESELNIGTTAKIIFTCS